MRSWRVSSLAHSLGSTLLVHRSYVWRHGQNSWFDRHRISWYVTSAVIILWQMITVNPTLIYICNIDRMKNNMRTLGPTERQVHWISFSKLGLNRVIFWLQVYRQPCFNISPATFHHEQARTLLPSYPHTSQHKISSESHVFYEIYKKPLSVSLDLWKWVRSHEQKFKRARKGGAGN